MLFLIVAETNKDITVDSIDSVMIKREPECSENAVVTTTNDDNSCNIKIEEVYVKSEQLSDEDMEEETTDVCINTEGNYT